MPRAGLSPARVVEEALDLLDEVGADGLTLTAVAGRVGVAVPSLYKHIAGLDDLRRRLAVHAVDEFGHVLADAARDRTGAEALHAIADAYRTWATTSPGRYAATLRAPEPGDATHLAASDAAVATLVAVMDGYGITGEDAIHAIRSVRAALHGFVSLEAAGGFGLPQDVDASFARMVRALDRSLAVW